MFEVFFLFPSPPQKGVKERVAALARERQSGNTLLIHLGWGLTGPKPLLPQSRLD